MGTSKKIFLAEAAVFLLPISVIALPGLLYMLVTPLGDVPHNLAPGKLGNLLAIVALEAMTLCAALALVSMWVATIRYLKQDIFLLFSQAPYVYVFIILGLAISAAAVVELFLTALGFGGKHAFFGLYIFGLPVCIPAMHLLVSSSYRSVNQGAEQTRGSSRGVSR